MSAADYVGRTHDLLALHGAVPGQSVLLEEALIPADGSGGYIVAGIEKLVQRFLLALLTVAGSKAYLPSDGCQFMLDAQLGRWRTAADVYQSFYASLVDVRRQLQLDEDSTTPDDETFAGATLESVELNWPTARLVVRMDSAAGSSRTFVAPLAVAI